MSKRIAQLEADIVSYVDTVEALEADIVAERAKALVATQEAERLTRLIAQLERDLAKADDRIEELKEEVVKVTEDLGKVEEERDAADKEKSELEERLEALNAGDAEVEDALLDLCASLGYGPNPLRVDSRELQRLLDLLH